MSGKYPVFLDGGAATALPFEEPVFVDAKDIEAALRTTFASPSYEAPLLPAVLLELMRVVKDPNVNFKQITRVLEREPLLTATTLRLAQSPAYHRAEPVRSLEDAIRRLGLRTVTDCFFHASINARVFRAPGFEEPMMRLRRHCTATAFVARKLCEGTALAEHAFTCGMLHDIGAAAAMIALSQHPRFKKLSYDDLRGPVFAVHEESGHQLATLWKLAPDIKEAIHGHHRVCSSNKRAAHTAAVVSVSELIAAELGYADDDMLSPTSLEQALDVLRITRARFDVVLDQAAAMLPDLVDL